MATTKKTARPAEVKSLSTLVDDRIALKRKVDELTEQLKDLDSEIIQQFTATGISELRSEGGCLQMITAETNSWNEEVLAEILGTKEWNKYSVRRLNTTLFKASLESGLISTDVSSASFVKKTKPYLRLR